MGMSPRLLRPRATGFHPEAQAWRNAVIANGGTVSGSTLTAVNNFCRSIDAAGIRDRFVRLNLFCGSGLSAALVPLYRGQSRTGTKFGGTIDTNNNFVSGDYAETGASAGLQSNGSTKFLNTGVKANDLSQTDRHLSCVADTSTFNLTSKYLLGMDNFGCGSNALWGILTGGAATNQIMVRAQASVQNSSAFNVSGRAHLLVSGNGSASVYNNGSFVLTGLPGAFTAPALDIYTHALNRCGSAGDYTSVLLQSYSIGLAMTASQVTSLYDVMLTFRIALSRT